MNPRRSALPIALLLAGAMALPAISSGQDLPQEPCAYRVSLPLEARPFPEPLPVGRTRPGFSLRGTKGWAWTPEQYLAEIPWLVRGKMNFLMNCYLSLFTDPEKLVNRWWEPLPDATRRGFEAVARACRENGIHFCFAVHPGLFSERPYRYDNEEDFAVLWKLYAWMQGQGVRWFSLSYDDIPVEGMDKASLGEAHGRLANRLSRRLREKDPEAQLIFCPVYYSGCGDTGDARMYLEGLARVLDPDTYLFWTGDAVVTPRITARCAEIYKGVVKHRLILWDNYPVNDRHPVLHLGPVTGRDAALAEIADGYMSNPLCPQNEINRIPLLTQADYAWNPWGYDPARSIGRAIFELAGTPAKRLVLKDLVELYPGGINCGDTRTSYNSVVENADRLLAAPGGRAAAEKLLARLRDAAARLGREFPGRFAATGKTITGHIAILEGRLAAAPATPR